MIEVPEIVRNKATLAGAAAWLDELPSIVAGLERDWEISVGRSFADATEALVAEARSADGSPAVLKFGIPRPGGHVEQEVAALRLAGGEGCVRLLRADVSRHAMLLERLGRSLAELKLPIEARHRILCSTVSQVWRPAPGCGLTSGAEKARWLADFITKLWEELDHPCSERAVDDALACAAQREVAHDEERAVLVHGDVHQWNTLEAGDAYKLVDPDGLLADPEYDLGVIMREDPRDLLTGDPRERSRWLASRTGLDETKVWEWGVVERVSTGLLGLQVGFGDVAREMLAVADRVAPD